MSRRSLVLLLVVVVVLAGCGSVERGLSTQSGSSSSAPVGVPSSTAALLQMPHGAQLCIGSKGPAPGPRVDWVVGGQSGNEWELSAEAHRSLTVTATVHSDVAIDSVAFFVAPEDLPGLDDAGSVLASFGTWGPGPHDVSIRWDGRDKDGTPIPVGRYRLFARTTGTSYQRVGCLDGSGEGVELNDGEDTSGLGVLVVSTISPQ